MRPEILIAEAGALADALAMDLSGEGERAIAARGRFTLALPGGSIAEAFFPRLARLRLDPDRVEFFSADERAVPPESPESNFGAAQRLWFAPAGVPPERTHRMRADAADLAIAAEAYEAELAAATGTPPRLDYVLLGIGPDGHIASLFPGHPLLREQARAVAFLEDAPKPPRRRLTLTLPVLCAARRTVIAALGAEKAAAVAEVVREPRSALPAALLVRSAKRLLFLLDRDAAVQYSANSPSG